MRFGRLSERLLEIPAYAPTAYSVVDEMTAPNLDLERLRSWIGTPVAARDAIFLEHGTLAAIEDGTVVILSIDHGHHGLKRVSLGSIGRIVPKAGRRGAKLGYKRILETAPMTIVRATAAGTKLALVARVPPDGRPLTFESETEILDILVTALKTDTGLMPKLRESPLTTALEADLEARGRQGAHRLEEIYPEIARRYITSFRVSRDEHTSPAWDDLSHAEVRRLLEAPWPTATIDVELTDARWGAHLDHLGRSMPICVRGRALPPAMESPPEPKRPAAPAGPPDQRTVLMKGDRFWLAERRGATWSMWTGKRSATKRPMKPKTLASAEKARAALEKAAAAKVADGWRAAPFTRECAELVERRTGLTFDEAAAAPFVVHAPPAPKRPWAQAWFEHGDRVEGVGVLGGISYIAVTTIEELALALESYPPNARTYLHFRRPSTNVFTGAEVDLR